MMYQGVFRPKIEYPLEQNFLTDKHVKKVESASLQKVIAKCGYNRNLPLGILGDPTKLSAARFHPFLLLIGTERILHLLEQLCIPKEDVGKALLIVMAWTQYQARVPYLDKLIIRSIIRKGQNSVSNNKIPQQIYTNNQFRYNVCTIHTTNQ